MKIEEQVVSLELAKKLKKLDVKQDSLFSWNSRTQEGKEEISLFTKEHCGKTLDFQTDKILDLYYSAFTVAELGELIGGHEFKGKTMRCIFVPNSRGKDGKFRTYLVDDKDEDSYSLEFAKTEADSRAKMLIYLIENKLLK